MRFKIDTREKFHVISIVEGNLAANMTEDMGKSLLPLLQNGVKNVVLNLKDIESIDNAAAEKLVRIQQAFYENNASFIIFGLNPSVEKKLDDLDLLGMMNVAPTESEASDIVFMEDIERELLDEGLE